MLFKRNGYLDNHGILFLESFFRQQEAFFGNQGLAVAKWPTVWVLALEENGAS